MLTDTASRKAVPGEKDRKLYDERELFLLVKPSGSKLWRMKYRFADKEKKLSIGPYPALTITAARQVRDKALQQLRDGIEPSEAKPAREAQAIADALDSFEKVARAWHEVRTKSLTVRYGAAVLNRLKRNLFPTIGAKPTRAITAPMVLEIIRRIEKRAAHDMAHCVRNHVSDVFVWAIASGFAETDPAAMIKKALHPSDPQLRPVMVRIVNSRNLLQEIESLTGTYWSTLLASRLLVTAAQPGVVRLAEKHEFEDLDGRDPIWRIPAEKMKLMRAQNRDITWEFVIPLSLQGRSAAGVRSELQAPAHRPARSLPAALAGQCPAGGNGRGDGSAGRSGADRALGREQSRRRRHGRAAVGGGAGPA